MGLFIVGHWTAFDPSVAGAFGSSLELEVLAVAQVSVINGVMWV